MDLLIPTPALVEEAPLATANRRHFGPVFELELVTYRA